MFKTHVKDFIIMKLFCHFELLLSYFLTHRATCVIFCQTKYFVYL